MPWAIGWPAYLLALAALASLAITPANNGARHLLASFPIILFILVGAGDSPGHGGWCRGALRLAGRRAAVCGLCSDSQDCCRGRRSEPRFGGRPGWALPRWEARGGCAVLSGLRFGRASTWRYSHRLADSADSWFASSVRMAQP